MLLFPPRITTPFFENASHLHFRGQVDGQQVTPRLSSPDKRAESDRSAAAAEQVSIRVTAGSRRMGGLM